MTSTNSTGPLVLGRWQQPVVAVQAGLLPADPYPLEKILFCATCGDQFFGTEESGGAVQGDGSHVSGNVRVYRTFCDHRPVPPIADEVELRVYAEAHVLAFGADAVPGLSKAHYALLALRFFTRIELGWTTDDISFTNRL